MGGVAMATAIDAAERTTGLPLLWATIQYINGVVLGDDVAITVTELGGGRSIRQVQVEMAVGEKTAQIMTAALGARAGHQDQQFAIMPDAPPPLDCPSRRDPVFAMDDNLFCKTERRQAALDQDKGYELSWMRMTSKTPTSASVLAILSDFILGSHDLTMGGTSLDNTLRIATLKQTDWVLCETRFSAFTNGAAQGVMHMFAEDGTLLATSSQTGLLPRVPNA
ncbi:unnamed protein product [Symbiodinium microadriaticum]|nr:unnamed protein product [Symbiodinium microadriaticum]